MTLLSAAERSQVLALLEQRHGVGIRGAGTASWLTHRVDVAVSDLARSRQLDARRVVDLLRADPGELSALADILRVGETYLYRDPPQWNELRRWLRERAPHRGGEGRLRALSVGCSTGEEAWTLAMVADEVGRPWRVVGVDRSESAIEVARNGTYDASALRHVPPPLRERYWSEASDNRYSVGTSLRRSVSFVHRDATTGLPPGTYEMVVCKNVLIYFGEKAGEQLVARLMQALAPGGVLVVARSEVPRLRAMGYSGTARGQGVTFFG